MLLLLLLIIPLLGVFTISTGISYNLSDLNIRRIKKIALIASIINLFLSFLIFVLFDASNNQFQFVLEYHKISSFDFYLGLDGLSIYFVLLTTMITPIALLSNWKSIQDNVRSYVIIILLLESLLLAVFLVLDILLFYIFFESILPPLFILIGLFGSNNKVRASFYLFLYTLFDGEGLHQFKCKIIKLRVSLKALVTKVVKETLLLAWLMSQGMVTLLEIAVMQWVIVYLNQALPVKEQRVDGYSNSMYLDFVWYTLVAGKPVFGLNLFFIVIVVKL